ncbi:hypothetical protein ABH926_009088 [Catenulispora sp. GP43]|uniref:NB-ARC domain-containing protein n=1 Tax=Catenulispora sp. GP43 TaxID=3156263 RepID=UPI003514EEFE
MTFIAGTGIAAVALLGSFGDALELVKSTSEAIRRRSGHEEPPPATPVVAADSERPAARQPVLPPVEFIGRYEDLAMLMGALRNPLIPLITLKGVGGIGKTALAQEAMRVAAAEGLFSSIFWHSTPAEKFVGEGVLRTEVADYSFDALVNDLLHHSQVPSSTDAPTAVKAEIVRAWLADHRVLIVLDNLETVPDRDALVAGLFEILGQSKALMTSRYAVIHQRVFTMNLEGLSPQDGVAFLVRTGQLQNNRNLMKADADTLARIRDAAGGAPLAMLLISGQMDYEPIEQVLRVVEEAGFNDLSYEFYSFMFRRTWKELDGPARKVLVAMRLFEGNPTAGAVKYTADMADQEFYRAAAMLVRRSMLSLVGGQDERYTLHPLTRYFISTDVASRWE